MTVQWDCSGCWQTYEYDVSSAERRFEKTTLHQSERVTEVFVCNRCGSLLEPYLDELTQCP